MFFSFPLFRSYAYAHPSACPAMCTHMSSTCLCQLSIKLLDSSSSNSFLIALCARQVHASCSPPSKLLPDFSFIHRIWFLQAPTLWENPLSGSSLPIGKSPNLESWHSVAAREWHWSPLWARFMPLLLPIHSCPSTLSHLLHPIHICLFTPAPSHLSQPCLPLYTCLATPVPTHSPMCTYLFTPAHKHLSIHTSMSWSEIHLFLSVPG